MGRIQTAGGVYSNTTPTSPFTRPQQQSTNAPNQRNMLAIFDWDTARAPKGLESRKSLSHHHAGLKTEAERRHSEELCHELLQNALKQHDLKPQPLSSGNGFAFEGGPHCNYSVRDGVHALFSGEVTEWPRFDLVPDGHPDAPAPQKEAQWLLDFYSSLDVLFDTDSILNCLSQLQGKFAFVLYDERRNRVTAARDKLGSEPLFWGVTDEGQLMLGTLASDLTACEPSAVAFPAGTLYVSQGDTVAVNPGEMGWVIEGQHWPGNLSSFVKGASNWRTVKEIPRVKSNGTLSGAVYRVDSERDLAQCGNA